MELANLKLRNFQYRKTIQDKSISMFFSLSKYTAVLFHKVLSSIILLIDSFITYTAPHCNLSFCTPAPQTIRLISVLSTSKCKASSSLWALCLEIPWDVEVKSHTFLTSARDENEWSLAPSGRPSMEHSIFPLQRNILFSIHRTFIPTLYVYTSYLTRPSIVRFKYLLKLTLGWISNFVLI